MTDLRRIASALADTSRVRLLAACFDGERCVCQLVALLGMSNAGVSKHLSLLRDAGLLVSRKAGLWVHYRLPDESDGPASEAIGWVRRHAADDAALAGVLDRDRAAMEQIMTMDPGALCRVLRDGGDVLAACKAAGVASDAGENGEECC